MFKDTLPDFILIIVVFVKGRFKSFTIKCHIRFTVGRNKHSCQTSPSGPRIVIAKVKKSCWNYKMLKLLFFVVVCVGVGVCVFQEDVRLCLDCIFWEYFWSLMILTSNYTVSVNLTKWEKRNEKTPPSRRDRFCHTSPETRSAFLKWVQLKGWVKTLC